MAYALNLKYNHLKINSNFKIPLVVLGVVFFALFIYSNALSFNLKNPTIENNYSFINLSWEQELKVLPKTRDLVDDLQKEGYSANAVSEIERNFFSVPGVIVTLDGDNIKVFEYRDKLSAEVDTLLFSESAKTKYYAWRKDVNLYLKDNLIIFYTGSRKGVLEVLKNTVGEPMKL